MNPTYFIFGVYMQPASSFTKWVSRGVNTVFTDKPKPDQPPIPIHDYFSAARTAGLGLVIMGSDPAIPNAPLAFCQPDEPEGWPHVVKKTDGSFDWPATTTKYRKGYEAFKSVNPDIPVFGNFAGGPLTSARETSTDPRNITLPTYRDFVKGADWVGADFYIRARGRPPEQFTIIGQYLDRLEQLKPGALKIAVIESCDQGLKSDTAQTPAHPTPAEVRAQVWMSIIHGAKGIAYFPLIPSGSPRGLAFSWDNTPTAVAAEMSEIAAEVQRVERFIISGKYSRIADHSAKWEFSDGSSLTASVTWDTGTKEWGVRTNITLPDPRIVVLQNQVTQLQSQLAEWRTWADKRPT